MGTWKFIVQGAAADNKVNVSQGRGPRDTFFHEHCSQSDPSGYIVFILQIESQENLCSEEEQLLPSSC